MRARLAFNAVVPFLFAMAAPATQGQAASQARATAQTPRPSSPASQTLPDVSFTVPAMYLPGPLVPGNVTLCDGTWKAAADELMKSLRACGLQNQDLTQLELREKGKSEQQKFELRLVVLQQLATKVK